MARYPYITWPAPYLLEDLTWLTDVADYSDLVQKAHRGQTIEPFDGEMPSPNSDDSYNRFVARRNPTPRGTPPP